MNNEYLKGVLDAKLSALLTSGDYDVFASFPEHKQIDFFLNLNLVQTKIVSDFETLAKMAIRELSAEIATYIDKDNLLYTYFFGANTSEDDFYKTTAHLNNLYEQIKKSAQEHLFEFVNKKHLVQNVIIMYRAKKQNIANEHIVNSLLKQNVYSEDLIKELALGSIDNVVEFVRGDLNIALENNVSSVLFEEVLENYLRDEIRNYAISPDVNATLIYYINEKLNEIYTLRKLFYTKGLSINA